MTRGRRGCGGNSPIDSAFIRSSDPPRARTNAKTLAYTPGTPRLADTVIRQARRASPLVSSRRGGAPVGIYFHWAWAATLNAK